MAFTLRFADSELAEIDAAALGCGVPRAQFVRQAALAAARQSVTKPDRLAEMVAEIHRVIVQGANGARPDVRQRPFSTRSPEIGPEIPPEGRSSILDAVCAYSDERRAAVAGLTQLGWTPAKAKRAISALPDGPAGQMIAQALKTGE